MDPPVDSDMVDSYCLRPYHRCIRRLPTLTVARRVGEQCLYGEPAAWAGSCVDADAVRGGDRADDGQAEAVAVWMARTVGGKPLEGPEKLVDFVGRHRGTCVGDR